MSTPSSSAKGDLFMGFDCSTQALKAVVLDSNLNLVQEVRVDYDKDLAHHGIKNGVIVSAEDDDADNEERSRGLASHKKGAVVKAPVDMYIEALDLVLERLKQANVDFKRIRCISGAAQQHSIILLAKGFSQTLLNAPSSAPLSETLSTKVTSDRCFATPWVTNWQDASTSKDCLALQDALGEDGANEMAKLTGSSAHERFSGPQLRKVFRIKRKNVWDKIDAVCLLSSWWTTIFCGDGEVKSVDEADATGTNLYSIPARDWDDRLLLSVTSGDLQEAEKLRRMLGPVATKPNVSAGRIGRWFCEKYGFSPDCAVASFTGDNPATLLSFSLQPGDAIVSMGTSDTVLLATETYNPHPNYHIMASPAGDASDGTRTYMAMLCYKNGSLAREMVRDRIKTPERDWATFNDQVVSNHPPIIQGAASEQPKFGFYFPKAEIIPRGVHGIFRFFDDASENAGDLKMTVQPPAELEQVTLEPVEARRILESQFLSFKSRIQQLLPASEDGSQRSGVNRIFVTGGASTNSTIVELLASVLDGKVYPSEGGTAQGCAVGGAYRAAWAYNSQGKQTLGFADFVKQARGDKSMAGVKEDRFTIAPQEELARAYEDVLPQWLTAEARVKEYCSVSQ